MGIRTRCWAVHRGLTSAVVLVVWAAGRQERAESAFWYSGAKAAAEAYSLLGNAITLNGSEPNQYIELPEGIVSDLDDVNDNMTLSPGDLGDTTYNWIGRSQYAGPALNATVGRVSEHCHVATDALIPRGRQLRGRQAGLRVVHHHEPALRSPRPRTR